MEICVVWARVWASMRIRSVRVVLIALALALAASCSKDMAQSVTSDHEPALEAARESADDLAPGNRVAPRKIIYTGSMTVEVEAYALARKRIEQMLEEAGGFIASSELHHSEGQVSSASLVLRVPTDGFASSVAAIGNLGTVRHETTHARDVTEQYVDLSARLRNSKRLEARLIELVATEVGKLVDLLAVETELARVRETVEQLEGQLRLLTNNVDLARLSVSLVSTEVFEAQDSSLGARARRTVVSSWRLLVITSIGLFLVLAGLMPWVVPLALAIFLLRRYWPRA